MTHADDAQRGDRSVDSNIPLEVLTRTPATPFPTTPSAVATTAENSIRLRLVGKLAGHKTIE
ncbi:MAG: hypothetical protein KBF76_08630 [Verrucomicrobiales bacterium]|nr:hypothetical protein [Verrucomicrobiales bacterium]